MTTNLNTFALEEDFTELGLANFGEDFKPIAHNAQTAINEISERVLALIKARRYEEAHEMAVNLERGECDCFGMNGVIVPDTAVNSICYEEFMRLNPESKRRLALIFSDHRCLYWLPEEAQKVYKQGERGVGNG